MIEIKTLAEAEEVMKESPHLYLVVFVTPDGRTGSAVMGMKEDAPLYKAYFIFNEANKNGELFKITNVVKLS